MPAVWFALKKSLQCRSGPVDVHDPNSTKGDGNGNLSSILTKKPARSGCSRSIANLKDVIHGSKRHIEKPTICSPRSIGSSELLNPITHEVVLSNSTCELKITGCGFSPENNVCSSGGVGGSSFVGTLTPGTPGPAGGGGIHYKPKGKGSSPIIRRTSAGLSKRRGSGFGAISSSMPSSRSSFGADSHGFTTLTCHKCREQFTKWEALETHHLSRHAVTELVEGDSSRKIVEIIYRTSWSKINDSSNGGIERILKVHNMQKTLAQFEDYREMVKIKASKLTKKHPRCLADGNELLRFYGTTVECSLGINGSSSLCTSDNCNVCRVLRHGFSANNKELLLHDDGGIGVFTASTSSRALESIDDLILRRQRQSQEDKGCNSIKKALIVCRVIAGRVHRPLENVQELAGGQSGFDSLAGKVGLYSNIEELYLLDAKALLPCFVVICRG